MVKPPQNLREFSSLNLIVQALRGPEGCPWDKEQTHRTLTPYAIEEAHELAEAIETGSTKDIASELGDVLLQVVLHAEIARQAGTFDIHDVIQSLSEKMVRRHPHVFADAKAANSDEVLDQWSKIKATERKSQPEPTRFDVPVSLPALSRSQKIGNKTKRERFDWSNASEVLAKIDEEIGELKEEMARNPNDRAALEHELGDVLFSVAQLARHLGLEAEQCLRTANSRFESRFFTMKKMIADSGRNYDSLAAPELEQAWQSAKLALKDSK